MAAIVAAAGAALQSRSALAGSAFARADAGTPQGHRGVP